MAFLKQTKWHIDMARGKKATDRHNSVDEVVHITSERLELLEAIHDLVRLEVKKQLTDKLVSGKSPDTHGGDSCLHKTGEQES